MTGRVDRIKKDHERYRNIVRGKIKDNLKKLIQRGDFIGKKGDEYVSVPVPRIDVPHFRHGHRQTGGAGEGEGQVGQPIGGDPQEGDGDQQAGDQPGQHVREVEVTIDELAEILGEELELPRIEPKGHKNIVSPSDKFNTISRVGIEGLLHKKRTYKEALKRSISSGDYNPSNPKVIFEPNDKRYKSYRMTKMPETNAVIFYVMDISGSMGDEQKEIARITSFWIDIWLKSQYDGLDTRYVVHDTEGKEVDEDLFYHIREGGGTHISSGYAAVKEIIEKEYNPEEWNIYLFHYSDGDNFGNDDDNAKAYVEQLLPNLNLFGFAQIENGYGSRKFAKILEDHFGDEEEKIVVTHIEGKEGIIDSIKDLLGKGK